MTNERLTIVGDFERENAGMHVDQTAFFDNADFLYGLISSYLSDLGYHVTILESVHGSMTQQRRRVEGAAPTVLSGNLGDVNAVERVMQYAYRVNAKAFREQGQDVEDLFQYPDENAMYYRRVLDPLFGSNELRQIARGEHPQQRDLVYRPSIVE